MVYSMLRSKLYYWWKWIIGGITVERFDYCYRSIDRTWKAIPLLHKQSEAQRKRITKLEKECKSLKKDCRDSVDAVELAYRSNTLLEDKILRLGKNHATLASNVIAIGTLRTEMGSLIDRVVEDKLDAVRKLDCEWSDIAKRMSKIEDKYESVRKEHKSSIINYSNHIKRRLDLLEKRKAEAVA